MGVKEIDNEKATKANASRGNVYTIHTTHIHTNIYFEHVHQPTMWSQKNSWEGETQNFPLQTPSSK